MPWDVEFHPRAIEEARAVRRWYAARSDAAATRFLFEFDRAMGRVASTPETGAPSHHGTRLHRIRRFPYYVIFREKENVLQVVAIAHAKRRPGYWKRRLA